MSILDLLAMEQVDERMDTDSLELARILVTDALRILRKRPDLFPLSGAGGIQKFVNLLNQIHQVLNKRFGVDGMTPLAD